MRETGEVLTVDFLGSVDGVPFEGGAGTDDTKVEIGGQGFIPGFSEGMLGMKPGDTRDIDVTFPAEYQAEALAGKAAVFKITAKSLAKPGRDGDRRRLRYQTRLRVAGEAARHGCPARCSANWIRCHALRIKRELLDVLAEKADFPSPQNLVEAEFGAIWQRVEQDMQSGEVDDEDRGQGQGKETPARRVPRHRRPPCAVGPAAVGDRLVSPTSR